MFKNLKLLSLIIIIFAITLFCFIFYFTTKKGDDTKNISVFDTGLVRDNHNKIKIIEVDLSGEDNKKHTIEYIYSYTYISSLSQKETESLINECFDGVKKIYASVSYEEMCIDKELIYNLKLKADKYIKENLSNKITFSYYLSSIKTIKNMDNFIMDWDVTMKIMSTDTTNSDLIPENIY